MSAIGAVPFQSAWARRCSTRGLGGSKMLRKVMAFGHTDAAFAAVMGDWFWRPWVMTSILSYGTQSGGTWTSNTIVVGEATSWIRGEIDRNGWPDTSNSLVKWTVEQSIASVWTPLGSGTMKGGEIVATSGQQVGAHQFEIVFDTPVPATTQFRVSFETAATVNTAARVSWGA